MVFWRSQGSIPKHPHGSSQRSVTLVPEDPVPSLTSIVIRHTHGAKTYIQDKHQHIPNKIITLIKQWTLSNCLLNVYVCIHRREPLSLREACFQWLQLLLKFITSQSTSECWVCSPKWDISTTPTPSKAQRASLKGEQKEWMKNNAVKPCLLNMVSPLQSWIHSNYDYLHKIQLSTSPQKETLKASLPHAPPRPLWGVIGRWRLLGEYDSYSWLSTSLHLELTKTQVDRYL